MKILIGGDFFISDNFEGKNLIDDSIIELFEKAYYLIVNLELSNILYLKFLQYD